MSTDPTGGDDPGGEPTIVETQSGFVPGNHAHRHPKRLDNESGGTAPANAHLTYYGGPVVSSVKVYAVFWGPNVNSTVKQNIGNFYAAITSSGYMDWLSEYNANNQTIGRGTFGGSITITPSTNANPIDDTQIQAEINNQINNGTLPAPSANTIYMIDFPPGVSITQGGSTSCAQGGFCAYHGTFTRNGAPVLYGVLPDMSAGSGCDTGCGSSTQLNNQTSVASHELIEAVTDPDVGIAPNLASPLAWYDANNGEIGDICNAMDGTITINNVNWMVQEEWSNQAGACIITKAANTPPPPNTGLVANGGFETGDLSSWTVAAGSVSVVGGGHGGNYAAQVGSSTAFSGNATLTQNVALPANSTIALSFWYKPYSNDSVQYDQQQMQVRNPNTGATLVNVLNVCSGSQTWTQVTQDLSAYAGQTVQLWFNDHDDGYGGDPTWYVLDDVTITATANAADTTAPTTSVTSPAGGATLSGTVSITASASDNVGVTKVQFYVDGTLLASTTTSPYAASWDTTKVANGAHSLTTKAYDAAGNVGTSAAVSVTVANAAATNLVTNGGFEGSLSGWSLGGVALPIDSTAEKHTGSDSARCGATTSPGQREPKGDSYAYQTVTIPANVTKATLTFWYWTYTTDTIRYDWQDAQVRSQSGTVLLKIFHQCSNNQAWVQSTTDLTAYKGQTVQIYFNVHGDGSTDPTTMWVDDVALTVQ